MPLEIAFLRPQNCQGQVLAVSILAAKVPNSDSNFAVEFCMDFLLLFFPRKKAPKSTKNPQQIHSENSPQISAEAFS